MSSRFSAYLGAIVFVVSPAYAGAESWLCITDKSNGFVYNTILKEWRDATFRVERNRYIIRKSDQGGNAFEVRKFGQPSGFPEAICKDGFEKGAGVFLHCNGFMGQFKFNRKTNRFLKTYLGGYWTYAPGVNDTREGDDTPSIDIGTCSPL